MSNQASLRRNGPTVDFAIAKPERQVGGDGRSGRRPNRDRVPFS